MKRDDPLVERNLGVLKDSVDGDRVLLFTAVALVETGAVGVTLKLRSVFQDATVGADRAFRPAKGFEIRPSRFNVAEPLHELDEIEALRVLHTLCIGPCSRFVKYIIPQGRVEAHSGFWGHPMRQKARYEVAGDKMETPLRPS